MTADYMGFSTFATDGMYYFAAPEVVAATEGIPPAEAREELKSADALANVGKTPGQAAAARSREAVRIIREHPWVYARIHLLGSLGVFLPAATDVLQTAGITRGERGTVDVLHTQGLVAAVRHYFGDNPARDPGRLEHVRRGGKEHAQRPESGGCGRTARDARGGFAPPRAAGPGRLRRASCRRWPGRRRS